MRFGFIFHSGAYRQRFFSNTFNKFCGFIKLDGVPFKISKQLIQAVCAQYHSDGSYIAAAVDTILHERTAQLVKAHATHSALKQELF